MLLTTRKCLQSCLIFLRNIGHAIYSLTIKCGKVEKTLFLDSQISGYFIDNIQLSILELFLEIAACCSNLCFGVCLFVLFWAIGPRIFLLDIKHWVIGPIS